MNATENPEPVVVYFSEVSELKALLEETRAALSQKGVNVPSLTTTDGKNHHFELLPENFRVTDHLVTQNQVRCKACSHEPALRYEFRVLTQDGVWLGPVGSTCLFTQVLGKSRAQTLGKKMQHHAIRESHNQHQRSLLAQSGNHYTYLSRLGLTWIHKPSLVKGFEVPKKLHAQFDEAVHGGIIGHGLFEHLQKHMPKTPVFPSAPVFAAAPVRASHPGPVNPSPQTQAPEKPHVPRGCPPNVSASDFDFWMANQHLIELVAPAGWRNRVNGQLTQPHQALSDERLKMMDQILALAREKEKSKTISDELWAFFQFRPEVVQLLPSHERQQLLDETQRLRQYASPWSAETLSRLKAQVEGKKHTPVDWQAFQKNLDGFWQHIEEEFLQAVLQSNPADSPESRMALAVLRCVQDHSKTARLHALTATRLGALFRQVVNQQQHQDAQKADLRTLYHVLQSRGLVAGGLDWPQ